MQALHLPKNRDILTKSQINDDCLDFLALQFTLRHESDVWTATF